MKKDYLMLDEKGTYILKFYANWCGPCKNFAPIFEKVLSDYPEINYSDIDIDENQVLPQKYMIKTIPSMVFIKEGTVVMSNTGSTTESNLRNLVEKFKSL